MTWRPPTLDTSPLQWSPSRRELQEYATWESTQPSDTLFTWSNGASLRAVLGGVSIVIVLATILTTLSAVRSAQFRSGAVDLLPFGVTIGIAVLVIAAAWLWQLVVRRRRRERFARIKAMAERHGLRFQPRPLRPSLPGVIFRAGQEQLIWPVVRDPGGSFEMGTAHYAASSSGKLRVSVEWGYLRFALPVPLPHMLLDARGNGRSLPFQPVRAQRFDLEGDFPDHFTLSAPKGYERDVLYVFTPDLMALLIDEAGDLDVEIVDDQLFVYAPHGIDLTNPGLWHRAWRLGALVAAKAAERSTHWRDERLPLPAAHDDHRVDQSGPSSARDAPHATLPPIGVAPEGQRLRRLRWPAIVLAAILVIGYIVLQLSALFSR